MEPQQFMKHYTCECFQPSNYCNCPYKSIAGDVLLENVRDVAGTLAEVMQLCGISSIRAKLSVDVVIYYFLHFEEIRSRIDTIPRKRLSTDDVLHDLNRKCDMPRLEAQIAYSIIKRAFRAFYHGTGEGGVPNPLLPRQLIHSAECMWVHAASRTAQVCAAYEGMFLIAQKHLECKIKSLYKRLYDRLASSQQPDAGHECACNTCAIRIMRESLKSAKVTTRMHCVADPHEEMFRKIVEQMLDEGNNEMETIKNHNICTCPRLKISAQDLRCQEAAEACNTGYSQGAFACHWFGIDKDEYEADDIEPDIKLPEEFPCVPCSEDHSSCDSECTCTCEVCTCHADDGIEGEPEVVEERSLATEEESLREEQAVTTTESNVSDSEFMAKYEGCTKSYTFLNTSPAGQSTKRNVGRSRGRLSSHRPSSGYQRSDRTTEFALKPKPTEN